MEQYDFKYNQGQILLQYFNLNIQIYITLKFIHFLIIINISKLHFQIKINKNLKLDLLQAAPAIVSLHSLLYRFNRRSRQSVCGRSCFSQRALHRYWNPAITQKIRDLLRDTIEPGMYSSSFYNSRQTWSSQDYSKSSNQISSHYRSCY